MNCQDATLSLGVYLMGALEPDERAAVETHLQDCPACQAELSELAELPTMLGLLRIEDVHPPASLDDSAIETLAPPADLFDRVAARARDEDELQQAAAARARRSRYRRLVAVAAAAVVIAGGVTGGLALSGGGSSPHTYGAVQGAVQMHVTLIPQATGTGLRVTVSGLRTEQHCWLIAVGDDGSRSVAGQWVATYSGAAQQTGSTSIPISQLSKLLLLGNGRKQLVSVDV
jgi:predicted anti-sigma-YlaC factor YlaD